MTIRFLRSQEIGYSLLLAERQRLDTEIREFISTVLKDNGGDPARKWEFSAATLTFTLKDDPEQPT